MATLSAQLAEIVLRPVDPAMRRRAALHVLDWIGCALAATHSDVGRILGRMAATPGPCTVLGIGRRDAQSAMLANGGLGNLLEMDDIHRVAVLHPGPVVIPAALATAEAEGASGAAFLDAVVRGYEAMVRVGRAVGPAHYRMWHNTSTCGPFGAAAAVGSLIGLHAAQLTHAFGNAGTQAAGPWQCRHGETMAKQLHTARAAQSGWLAAMLAREGFTGPPAILEGPQGFFAAMCPDATPSAVVASEPDWLIREVGFKPYPACRHTHAVIDAALALRARLGAIDATRISAVEISTFDSALALCDRETPTTTLAARFSLQHAAAVSLLDGEPDLASFEPPCFERADIAALRHRTTVRIDDIFGHAVPIRFRARVTITIDGATHGEEIHDAKGDPANPIGPPEIEAKAMMLMRSGGVDDVAARAIVAATHELAEGGTLPALGASLLQSLPHMKAFA
jgi:2-methylcitrate dehydratase PrpD